MQYNQKKMNKSTLIRKVKYMILIATSKNIS